MQRWGQLTQPVLYNPLLDPSESRDVAAAHPDAVQQMLALARAARQELSVYSQRGEGQRPTGSIFPRAPVISHEKEWAQVDVRLVEELNAERKKRYPGVTDKKRRK